MGMGEAVDTIPSILNKCHFVSPDRQTDGQAQTNIAPKLLRSWGHNKLKYKSINQFNKRKIETSPMTLSSVAILSQE